MYKQKFLAFIAITISLAAPAASAAVIDINARVHGLFNPVQLFLTAGTYTLTPVDPSGGGAFTAYTNWARTSCADPTGCQMTVPTSVTGWRSGYEIISDALIDVSVGGTSLTPIASEPTDLTFHEDHFLVNATETRAHIGDSLVFPNATLAFPNTRASSFVIDADAIVGFSINDLRSAFGDNSGGISLRIDAYVPPTNSVPLPASIWLVLAGVATLFGISRWGYTI